MLLGIKIKQEDHTITLSQQHYIEALLKKFHLENANPVSTPMDPNVKLDDSLESKVQGELDPNSMIAFRFVMLIGCLMYLALGTHPDIVYTINKLSQYASIPQLAHWTAVKHLFQYLKGTWTYKLTYGSGSDDLLAEDLNIYCNADWANDADRKSISGYVVVIAGGADAWSSKKQATVALSISEAEYIAAIHAAKQVIWQCSLLRELNFPIPTTSTIFLDNQAAISIAHHPKFHTQMKHIDIAHHFLCFHLVIQLVIFILQYVVHCR